MSYFEDNAVYKVGFWRGFILGLIAGTSLGAVVTAAKADLVTEFGGGMKWGESYVLSPACMQVRIDPENEVPCGGDNPVFIGWPLAWDFTETNLRFGWFHYSNWFDGRELTHIGIGHGDEYESDFNCLCVSWKFNWSEMHERRRAARSK